MKNACLAATALLVTACGYQPLYAPSQGGADAASRLQVGAVQMEFVKKNVGERRVAQLVSQELKQDFPATAAGLDTLNVTIEETESTLAVQRTAAVERSQVNLLGKVNVMGADGTKLLETTVSSAAAYNVENTPYSTESGKTFARQTAARNLAREISRRMALLYRQLQHTTK